MDWTIKAAKLKNDKPAGNWLNNIQKIKPNLLLSPDHTERIPETATISSKFTPIKPNNDNSNIDTTPLSLRQIEKDTTVEKQKNDTTTKLSLWSPYKHDSIPISNNNATETIHSHESNSIEEKNETGTTSKLTAMSLNSATSNSSATTTTKIENNTLSNATVTRMKRRSNMFVPIPKKDPLIVHDTIQFNQNHTFSGTTLKVNKQTNLSPKDHSNKLKKNQRSTINYNPTRQKITQSPVSSKNVFDRLSSTSTQSFNKKITHRSHMMNKKHATSSIDLSGSPLRRINTGTTRTITANNNSRRQLLEHDNSNWQVRETLKNIFATDTNEDIKNETYSKETQNVRRSLIPSLNNSGRLSVSNTDKRHSINIGGNDKKHNSNDKNLSIIGEEKSSRIIKDRSPSNVEHSQIVEKSEKPKTANRDHRLTKFNLLRSDESNKQDLKKKLNKRLSEVMKTQQETEKQRRNKHKKLLNNEANATKPRGKNFSEFKSFGTVRKLSNVRRSNTFNDMSQISDNGESHLTKLQPGEIDTRNILDALKTGDFRARVGEPVEDSSFDYEDNELPAVNPLSGNDTLPEIFSDSDQEDTNTLQEWARAPQLHEQLIKQQNWDTKKIFGPVPPLHINEIFKDSQIDRLKSTSQLNKK
ncbi:hypothetical protein C6P45_000111 [Maudiozyma exigua]|uniref:Inner centromere protein ARK-binding domain-containing protein n=1 Tax=Maudiozyma exigua TaxID=34358 RepID=A0A9P7BC24_MAUEX|nr:hypothetical protein C6P45_000111 [Kazachstania exigua]